MIELGKTFSKAGQASQPIVMRDVEKRDYQPLYDIFRRANLDFMRELIPTWDESRSRSYFTQYYKKAKPSVLMADDAIAGYCTTEYPDADTLYISQLHIDPDFQGQRIGQSVLSHCTDLALKSERELRLHVLMHNSRARSFYERNGFKPSGTLRMFEGTFLMPMVNEKTEKLVQVDPLGGTLFDTMAMFASPVEPNSF